MGFLDCLSRLCNAFLNSNNDHEELLRAESSESLEISIFRKGNAVSLDCEFFGGCSSFADKLRSVTIVSYDGRVLLNAYRMENNHYFSGLYPSKCSSEKVRRRVKTIVKDKVLVGHGLNNDFKSLKLSHRQQNVVDTVHNIHMTNLAMDYGLRSKSGKFALKHLAKDILGLHIQTAQHSSEEDARTIMLLYKLIENEVISDYQSELTDVMTCNIQ